MNPRKVNAARRKELEYIRDKEVWVKMSRTEAQRRGIRIIQVRWIDVNKGDTLEEIYRSRLVAKESNAGKEDGLFASTPPLEALRVLISEAATTDGKKKGRKVVIISDVVMAYFETPMKRAICVELLHEARDEEDDRMDNVALRQKSIYGTRDAAANFQAEVKKYMRNLKFSVGKYNASTFYNHEKT